MSSQKFCSVETYDNTPTVCRWGISWLCIIAILSLTGCGSSDRIPINGVVTLNGKPLSEGSISLEPVDGVGPTAGGKITDGKYALTDEAAPLAGKKTVRISGAFKTGRRIPAGPPLPPGTMVDEIGVRVPGTYNQKSTLTCEVSRDGVKQIDFNLKTP